MEIISIIKVEMKLFSDFSAHAGYLGACGVRVSERFRHDTFGRMAATDYGGLIVRLRRRAF